jgi:calcineurin-like phosphoesterase family protein
MIQNWNATVTNPNDIVIHTGDFSLPDRRIHPSEKEQNEYTANIIKSLNGRIIIIFGSHDKHTQVQRHLFFKYHNKNTVAEYYIDNYCVLMSHVPLLSWEKRAHGSLCAFGHVHTNPQKPFLCSPGSYDVGQDNNDFRPVSFAEFVRKAQAPEGKLNLDIYDNMTEDKKNESPN